MADRPARFGLGRFYGPAQGMKPNDFVRRIFEYWRDTVTNMPVDEVNRVVNVNTNKLENKLKHRTDEYDDKYLAVRRGQSFTFDIELQRKYIAQKDDFRMVFQFGKNPRISKGTDIELPLSDKEGSKGWKVNVVKSWDTSIKVEVTTPPDCYVGKWTLMIDNVVKDGEDTSVQRYKHEPKIYILFNPWCKDDDVYLEEEEKRMEYVLNDKGKIYAGHPRYGRSWVFGQFEEVVLDCALYLLDELSKMKDIVRGNPTNVCRKISALVNKCDPGLFSRDTGVLVGNWSGDYADGTSPLAWTGSVKILEEYYKNKSSVNYGQCWVFSGVVTTICRTLGIPARSVTNFDSAHDTDCSLTIDKFVDEDSEPIDSDNTDSVWNFHVWNDVWMKRPDLPDGHDGWQAIDATPQETSDGVFQMGPMSLKAVKEGNVTLPYDGGFLYSEINGDKITWMKHKDGTYTQLDRNTNAVGSCIVTKAVGSNGRDLITLEYKHQEWGKKTKAAAERALRHAEKFKTKTEQIEDVEFKIDLPRKIYVGSTLTVKLELKNTGKESRKLKSCSVLVSSVYYTGIIKSNIKPISLHGLELLPGEEKTIVEEISADDYFKHLTDFCQLRVYAVASVETTKQSIVQEYVVTLKKPKLSIKAVATCVIGTSVEVEVSFTNPLDMPMTACKLEIEGTGLQKTLTLPQKNVPVKGTFIRKFSITPIRIGKRELVVNFNSDQLLDISRCHEINVTEEKQKA